MLDACFRCSLMNAKWRGINLSLIYWPCSVNTAPGSCWSFQLPGLTSGTGSSRCPPEPPGSPQKSCPSGSQTPASITVRGYLPLSVLIEFHNLFSRCELKESPCLVPFQAMHMTGNQTNSHEPGERQPFPFLLFTLGQIMSPLSFNVVI